MMKWIKYLRSYLPTGELLGAINNGQEQGLVKMLDGSRVPIQSMVDFLDVGQLEAGRIELAQEALDVESFLRASFENHRLIAEERNISMAAHLGPGVSTIHADRRRLEQVLNNLFSNALKFTLPGGDVEFGAVLEEGAVKIWLKDTGAGIAIEAAGELFENGATAGVRNAKHNDSGLGLAICRTIVEAHGGRICATSVVGKGTTVAFTMPIAAALVPRAPIYNPTHRIDERVGAAA
jgi:signal transduction histidine kinase